jgi:hypothetical protein
MIEDNDEKLENFDITELNIAKIIENLHQYDMIRLCDIIICDRYLGFNPELATACMEELGRRRSAGDTFDFEEYIEREYKALPKLEFSVPDLRSALDQVMGEFKR